MLKRPMALLLLLLFFPFYCYSQNPKKHPTDKALDDCIEKNPTTAGMTNCLYKAQEMWDTELNKAYNELATRLDPEGKQALKAAQVEWIKYRDTEYKLIDALYSRLEGTMYIPMRVDARMDIVKKRAQKLTAYMDLAKEQ